MSIIGHETLTYSRARDQLAYAHGFPGTGRRNRRFIVPWPTSSSLSSPARVTRLSLSFAPSRQQWLGITINKAKMSICFLSNNKFFSFINFFLFISIDYKSVKELSIANRMTVLDKGDRVRYRIVNILHFMAWHIKSFWSIESNEYADLIVWLFSLLCLFHRMIDVLKKLWNLLEEYIDD